MERLRGEKDFQRVFSSGERVQHPLVTLLFAPGETHRVRVGFCVSKKFGGAVKRNRLKRRLRESGRWQLSRAEIAGAWDIICLPRARAAEADFASLCTAWQDLLARAGIVKAVES
jgi:ribonuclease P protein component